MKQGYLVGYIFATNSTIRTHAFLIPTNDKKEALYVAKNWVKKHKKAWGLKRYNRLFACKVNEKNIMEHKDTACNELVFDKVGGVYWVEEKYTGI